VKQVKSVKLWAKKGRFKVNARVDAMEKDVLVTLTGGAVHIGAIGIGEPRPSIRDPKKLSASSSVFTFIGHKEDEIAKSMAEGLARNLNRRVVVVAGIHWDGLTKEEIEIIFEICQKVASRITEKLTKISRLGM
jgi:hypothetical protein